MIETVVATVFDTLQTPLSHEMSLVITDDENIRKYNRRYREMDSPTDVLSFEGGEINPENGLTYAGDIIISGETLLRQAMEAGHPAVEELQLLLTHGTLHLMGFDHSTDAEKEKMWKVQKEVLIRLGCTSIKLD